jgi:hypothetical protein
VGPMVRGSFEDFDQWEFVIGRRHVAPPWQNGCAERLIGSIRRECLDHVVVFIERRLRHLLLSYMKYCNKTRTHLLCRRMHASFALSEAPTVFLVVQFRRTASRICPDQVYDRHTRAP